MCQYKGKMDLVKYCWLKVDEEMHLIVQFGIHILKIVVVYLL